MSCAPPGTKGKGRWPGRSSSSSVTAAGGGCRGPRNTAASGAPRSIRGSSSTNWRAPVRPLTVTTVAPAIMRVGTEKQKQTWLPRIKAAEVEFALGYSEPEAGTDLAAVRTRATLDGDTWVVNGQKMWNTMAHMATHN